MLPSSAQRWLSDHRPPVLRVTSLPSSQGQVWRVELDDSQALVVKSGPAAAIEREVSGLSAAAAIGRVPSIVARPERTVVVMICCPGASERTSETLEAAGAWLRRLHALECDDTDPLDLRDALLRRRDAWLGRAPPDIDVASLEALDFEAFAGQPRVICHRDFTPSNWLWDPRVGLTVIDFGQSRPDAALWDLVKLEGETFRDAPALREAFYRGYGGLNEPDAARLRALVLLHGLQTAVWGDTHGDAAFSALGRTILGYR